MMRFALILLLCCSGALAQTITTPPATPVQPALTAAQQAPLDPALPTLFIVGDSTARNGADLGWGDHFAHFFNTTTCINVANRAHAGRSSRTFINEGSWDKVLAEMKPGDTVLLQMGHNDGGDLGGAKPRGTIKGLGEGTQDVTLADGSHELVHTYGWYMRKYIADTRAKGATPVLLTLTVRNIWTDGHIERDMGYDAQLRQLAAQQHVALLDMGAIAADQFEALGQQKTAALFPIDHTHTSAEGAEMNALAVVKALREAHLSPAACLKPEQAQSPAPQANLVNGYEPKWWKEAVVYQIYPRSFKDSNGDGIGDLNGITSKLDYLQALGINVIWLSPHYDSPNVDNGYDIRDYRKVMADFGTMADFDRMLAAIKARHMRLIIDLVVNHTSDEHRWFVESASSRTNPFRDFYIWRDGKPDPAAPHGFAPPNNYPSYFSGSAWQWSEPTKQFYLHLFARQQPDLNWDNPKVREEVYSLMRFWLDKGVDGFRMDVIPLISKQPGLPDLTPAELKNPSVTFANGPKRDQYLEEMNRDVLSRYDDMTVGEAIGITLAEEPAIVDSRKHELNMVFNFDAVRINRGPGPGYNKRSWTLPELKALYDDHAVKLGKTDWDTVFLSNHDNPRLVSNFGDDSAAYRAPSAKLIETMIMTLRGTAFIYQGDELGMTNYPFTKLDQFNDIEVKNLAKAQVATGNMTAQHLVEGAHRFGRDNARTPMQWSGAPQAGFTAGSKPWLAVNPNYTQINAAAEASDPSSVLNFTRQLLALRAQAPAFVYGDYKDLDPANPQVYAYTRTLPAADAGDRAAGEYLVVLNFSSRPADYTLPAGTHAGTAVLSNYSAQQTSSGTLHLKPWEARIYRQ